VLHLVEAGAIRELQVSPSLVTQARDTSTAQSPSGSGAGVSKAGGVVSSKIGDDVTGDGMGGSVGCGIVAGCVVAIGVDETGAIGEEVSVVGGGGTGGAVSSGIVTGC
jgi:hypothetical protein